MFRIHLWYQSAPMAAVVIVVVAYVLHQDFWFWRAARPLIFGFLPVGLFYHAAYTLGSAILLWWLVRSMWPGHLEAGLEPAPSDDPLPRT